jgi:protein-L-isoaspartate(D-aspartate) O-methyltransferase
MVSQQIEARGIDDPDVLRAMRTVPRHLFVPVEHRDEAYGDHPLPIGFGQTISQPYIVALMTQLAEPDPEDNVLEVGTGSGYQAAVLAEIVLSVHTIEILAPLGERARALLEELGYFNVETRIGDGYQGWKEHGPFDVIVVTAAAEEIPPPLIEQLKPGGTLVIPVGEQDSVQTLMQVRKEADGTTISRSLIPVRFVPLVRER